MNGTQTDRFEYVVEIAPARATGQDRAGVFARPGGLVIALADGAGGTGNGAIAAQAFLDTVDATSAEGNDWCKLIEALDQDVGRLGHGQTTAVVLSIGLEGVTGASVGDSGAWLVRGDVFDLTAEQQRKPLVGAGCIPVKFHADSIGNATLVVASDGLFRYAKARDIARIVQGDDLAAAARLLIELVRLPTGDLQDDVAVVLCREVG